MNNLRKPQILFYIVLLCSILYKTIRTYLLIKKFFFNVVIRHIYCKQLLRFYQACQTRLNIPAYVLLIFMENIKFHLISFP